MDVDKAREIAKNNDYDKVEGHDLIEGIKILAKYNENEKYNYQFEHDQMWFLDFEETVAQMTEEEVKKLFGLGWFEDEESWSLFA